MFGQKAKEGYESTEYVRADIAEARIAELESELARFREDRPFVIGWNDGFETALNMAGDECDSAGEFRAADVVRALRKGATND